MNVDQGKTSFTADEIAELRARVDALRGQGLTWDALAADSGIPRGTLSSWATGAYQGDVEAVAARVRRWLLGRDDRDEQLRRAPEVPVFQKTPTAEKLTSVLSFCQALGEFGLICTPPGQGKTATITQYSATRPRVYVATMEPATRGVNNMLIELLEAMGERDAKGTPQALSRRVMRHVAEPGGLIVIDEAQHLSDQAIEQLRSIHDKTGVGLVLSGNEDIYAKITGAGKKAAFAQVTSRIGMRVRIAEPRAGDVEVIAQAWGISAKSAETRFLKEIARKPGGLRGVTKTLRLAFMVARGNGEALSLLHLRDAWGQLAADPMAA